MMNIFSIFRAIFKREFWLYILLSFPIIDYLLRNVIPIPIISSLWDEGVMFVLLLFMAIRILHTGRKIPSLKKPFIALTIMGIAYIVLDMPHFAASLQGFRAMFQYMIAFFIGFYLLDSKDDLIKALRFLVIISSMVGLYGIYQYIAGVPTPGSWVDASEDIRTRAFSIVQSPNVLGSHMAFMFPIALSLVIMDKKWSLRIIWIGTALIFSACLVFTFSRGAWLAFAGSIFLISVLIDKRLFILAILGGIAGFLFVPEISDRIMALFSDEYLQKSAKDGRIHRWLGAFDQMRNEPFFGKGLGHYGGAVADRFFGTIYVDSYYFKTLAETGLLGITLYAWLLLSVFKNGYQTWKKESHKQESFFLASILTGLFAIMLHNGVENIFEVPYLNTYFWLVTGFLLSFPYLNDDRKLHSQVDKKVKGETYD